MSPTEIMQRALRLAAKGMYSTDPNPRVGCVLVKDGAIVGEGWHRRAGGAHAEINALAAAGENASGCTAFVTLEPCNHSGKTAPCTDALIAAGVSKVVAAMVDPNPLVAGKGLQALQQQGIETETGLLEAQAMQLNPGFIKRMQQGRPFVRLKMAMSLDGRTAMSSGESKWITGAAARHDVQRYRARSSAILTGIGTVLQDDPQMDVRVTAEDLGLEDKINQPLRVVLDSQARMPADARMLSTAGEVLHITAQDVPSTLSCHSAQVAVQNNALDLQQILKLLAEREVNELHVECGATLAGSFLSQGLVDELVLYMAPHIMGDAAKGLFALPGLEKMQDRIDCQLKDVRMVGGDVRMIITMKNEK
jgi:diaminohydroxyphosphoribosylaminopyrimidine deaminase/5-amino-6-(5-phosphoribosylamino)uracil reductase